MQFFKKILDSRFKIATQLYMGIGFVAIIGLVASAVSWQSFRRIGEAQKQVNEISLPELRGAFGIAQRSAALIDVAPRLIASNSVEDLDKIFAGISTERALFEARLLALLGRDRNAKMPSGINPDQTFERIREVGDRLISNVEEIRDGVLKRLELASAVNKTSKELLYLQPRVNLLLTPFLDDQLFFNVTGYRSLGQPAALPEKYRSAKEMLQYQKLSVLREDANLAMLVLSSVFSASSVPLLGPQRERFEAAGGGIRRNLEVLKNFPGAEQELVPLLNKILEIGEGQRNAFDLRRDELLETDQERRLLEENRSFALELVSIVERIVDITSESASDANKTSAEAVANGNWTLLFLSILSVLGAILVGRLFVGRFLIRRLEWLAERMRKMAEGDLKEEVKLEGKDEVANMAEALEVFRLSSLEALRVDMAEKLANELQSKNVQLENVLGDLKTAQNQIVMREKLAALGELTAGVAHEIKNPLNFIKNFSEATAELVDELTEEFDSLDDLLKGKQKEIIMEISEDLKGNAGRIKEHSERANRIVHDMLLMGRGGGERVATDINTLLEEHARLAFHSARASDSEFQLKIVQELDPNIGRVEVIPQDLGRLFLNLVGNACYATDKQRHKLLDEAQSAISEEGDKESVRIAYEPTLSLVSKKHDDHFEVFVRDNGCGISEENIKKIFNPFFTTKPADQGTGLGLALSSDIIRAHGGTIAAESKLEEFTQMTLKIPLKPPENQEIEDAEKAGVEHEHVASLQA